MIGLGTLINALAIVVGGIVGLVCKKFIKERYQETIIKVMGIAVFIMAIGSVMSQMLIINKDGHIETQGTMMMIFSLALGAIVGEMFDIDQKFERFGKFLRDKSGNQKDSSFIDAFVSSSLTVCIGAMAILGAISDGLYADHSVLYAKAILDLVIIMMMTSSMGKGCIFSAIPVVVLQGSVTLLARALEPVMTNAAISNMTLVGNILILCVGINLIWPKTIRVANILPALIFAVIFAIVF